MPPGGPPDIAAPQLIAIVPDSGTLGASPKEMIFRFDEVVAERPKPRGTARLSASGHAADGARILRTP
jgi:hypothetical protein